jgi:ceramide glucosyltransferase
VLKPVRGTDDDMEANLESLCLQSHPRYEIIVGAAEPDDPALQIARRVQLRYPHVRLRVVWGQWQSGCNPKVRNLRNLLAHARYPAVLVSDGDVRVDQDYLSAMAGALEQPNVGLVSNLVVGFGERTLGAACENAQFNGFIAAATSAAALFARHPIVVGKSMLFRRDALTNAGGFAAAADVLAEDYLLGRAVLQAGYRVVTLGIPIRAFSRDRSLVAMVRRQLRWAQIRRQVAPAVFALEPLGHPLIWLALITVIGCLAQRSANHWLIAGLLLGAATLQTGVAFMLRGTGPRVRDIVALPLTSVLALAAWTRAWFDVRVVWRQQAFRIGRGSRLTPIVARQTRRTTRIAEPAWRGEQAA